MVARPSFTRSRQAKASAGGLGGRGGEADAPAEPLAGDLGVSGGGEFEGFVELGHPAFVPFVREVAEEVCIDVAEIEPVIAMPYRHGVDFLFEARRWSGDARIGEPEFCDALTWAEPARLPEPTAPFVTKALELRAAGDWYHEFR